MDVAILGGGLAGLSLARLFQRECPEAKVLVLERGTEFKRKVGESTVEIGAHLLHERLGLAPELVKSQLPKNGLRFWFDDEEHSLGFSEASEDGPATYAYFRSYQFERETLEATLFAHVEEGQTPILRGVRKLKVDLTPAGPHRVHYEHEGQLATVSAKWVVDATGFRRLLGGEGNLAPEPRLNHSATWGWFKDSPKLDDLVQGAAAKRMIFSERFLSTNHLLNEGYWTWVIPLASGLNSIGVGFDEDHPNAEFMPRTPEQFKEFLHRHKQTRELTEGATMVDYGAFNHMAKRPTRFVSEQRVAWIGTAAGFVDPFFSNGIDMIALSCEATIDTIRIDLRGTLTPDRIERVNNFTLNFYEHFVLSVAGLYPTFASQELSVLRYRREVHVYWALYTWAYMNGPLLAEENMALLDPAFKEAQARDRLFSRMIRSVYRELKSRGDLRRFNKGRYTFNQLGWRFVPYVRFEQHVGGPMDVERSLEATREIDTGCLLALLDVLYNGDRSPQSGLMFAAAHPVFPGLLADYKDHEEFDAEFFADALARINVQLKTILGPEVELATGLTPESFKRAFHGLTVGLSDEQAKALRVRFNRKPELIDFSDMPRTRDKVQTQDEWTVEHTPWLEDPPAFRSIYDLLGDDWWQSDVRQPFAVLQRLREELAGTK
ncbi:MAG: tryptophan 7-halogenase [Planctomycetes bacterium]|nr:tryptophan 7-halogenase [Planctomycetota bacterium]